MSQRTKNVGGGRVIFPVPKHGWGNCAVEDLYRALEHVNYIIVVDGNGKESSHEVETDSVQLNKAEETVGLAVAEQRSRYAMPEAIDISVDCDGNVRKDKGVPKKDSPLTSAKGSKEACYRRAPRKRRAS